MSEQAHAGGDGDATAPDRLSWTIVDDEAGQRLDLHLARRLERPRNRAQRWIADGRVLLNGRSVKASTLVAAGDRVEYRPPPTRREPGLEPEAGELDVLYEDGDLAVINKAAGIAVHPGAGRAHGTLAHFLLARFPEVALVGGRGRPGIVHRLDKDTSGALVIARSEAAYLGLQRAFAARQVTKTYLGIAWGAPREARGEIALPIARHRHERKKMDVRRHGRPALTRYRTRRVAAGISLLELDLQTGRTHQIRVHLKAVGHPLVGDPVYGEKRWRGLPPASQTALRRFPRPALHAWRLSFEHPLSGKTVATEAPVPEDLRELWQAVTGEAVSLQGDE